MLRIKTPNSKLKVLERFTRDLVKENRKILRARRDGGYE